MKRLLILILAAGLLGGLGFATYQYKQQVTDGLTEENQDDSLVNKTDASVASKEWLPVKTLASSTSRFVALRRKAMRDLDENWRPEYAAYLIEAYRMGTNIRPEIAADILELLERRTGEKHGRIVQDWYDWSWSQDFQLPPEYADYKKELHKGTDPKFAAYFSKDRETTINLQQVVWGGVFQDGIPPLRSPKVVSPDEVDYLADTDVVFGIEINGDARAYPKRILAHHEMFTDTIGDVSVCGVY